MPNEDASPFKPTFFSAALLLCWLIIPINVAVFFVALSSKGETSLFMVFATLCAVQTVAGIVALVTGIQEVIKAKKNAGSAGSGVARIILSVLGGFGGPIGFVLGIGTLALAAGGGAWGRPLRVKGRQLHPELKEGADWTAGDRPDASSLDVPTRRALEALWLHDAQKEHASVPAFSRISWLLAAVGAPADLMSWSHRAAIEEIDHTQRCFALAAGYGARTFTVEPMPELLLAIDVKDPLITLAVESLKDGCLLEDFNADVAAKCASVCDEPVTHAVLEQIAREERSHADFSWALIDWLLATHGSLVAPKLREACDSLETVQRPTNATPEKQQLISAANAGELRRHGRLEDHEWGECWNARLITTRQRMETRLASNNKLAA